MLSTISKIALRPYQAELLQAITSEWEHHRRVLAQLPTGGGKTVVFSAIAQQFPNTLVLAHRTELITQAADKLQAITGNPVGVIKAGFTPDYLLPIQVASVQSLIRRLERIQPPALIVVDEAHHSTAATYRRILEAFPEAHQLGVTATPIRTDGSGFEDLFDSLVCGPKVAELIDGGHLSQFRLFADPHPMSTAGARTRQGDYSTGDVAELNPVIELAGNLIGSYRERCPGKRCVVFAVNVEHSQAIADRYNQAGIPAAHLDGNSSADDRKETLEAFARGDLLVLSNCNLFTEGFDLPALDAVQIARPTKSLGLWLQMVGRVLRPAPGKDHAIILDHTKNWAIHGLPTRPRRWKLTGVEVEERKVKPDEQGEVQESLPLDLPPEIEILESAATLAEVDISPEAEWLRVWDGLVLEQQQRQYKPAWLIYQLKELDAPLEVWRRCADYLGYKPGWAWHRWQETQGQQEAPAPLPPIPDLSLSEIWEAVIEVMQPFGARALFNQQGSLVSMDGYQVKITISAASLLKMAQGRVTHVEDAFEQVLGWRPNIKLILDARPPQVATADSDDCFF